MLKTVYAKTKESLRTADKLVVTFLCLALVAIAFVMPAYADGTKGHTDNGLGGLYLNIEDFSALISDSFSNAMTETTTDSKARATFLKAVDQTTNNSNRLAMIGNVLGVKGRYTEISEGTSVFTSGDDQSAKRLTLEIIGSWYGNNIADMNNSAMAQYILLGSTLNELGVDEFRDAQGNSDGFRMIAGYAIYVLYILAYSASGIMQSVVDIMDRFNVFAWIHEFMVGDPNTANSMNMIGADSAFMNTLREIYKALMDFRWIVFGVMLVLFVASITVFKSKQMNNAAKVQIKLRNLGLRVVVMCIGIPLVGMVYTTMIDLVGKGLNTTQYRVSDFIYAQFMDYERWAVYEPMNAFNGISKIEAKYASDEQSLSVYWAEGQTDAGEAVNASEFVYEINKILYPGAIKLDYDDIASTEQLYNTNSTVDPNKYGNMLSKSEYTIGDGLDSTLPTYATDLDLAKKAAQEGYATARELILGYARGNRVIADSVNSAYFTALSDLTANLRSDDQDDITANRSFISTIFAPNASTYDVWSYVGLNTNITGDIPAIYEDHDKVKEIDAIGYIKPRIYGIPYFAGDTLKTDVPGVYNGIYLESGYFIQSDENHQTSGGGAAKSLMRHVLGMYYSRLIYTDTTNGDVITSSSHINSASVASSTYASRPYKGLNASLTVSATSASATNEKYEYEIKFYDYGMSPLSIYNFMHSRFSLDTVDIYSPSLTSNSGVSMMHYAITTPYTGIPELVQLLYTICILFSVGIIGWVFGISLIMNTIVQTIKAMPLIFKLAVGSIQGFVEALLTVLSIIAELFVTIMLYVLSIQIIDFLILAMEFVIKNILSAFVSIDGETLAIVNNLLSMFVIAWGTFELIKWRQAITISIKSLLTHVLNQVFGTSAEMPSSASNGMLKAAAIGATAAVAAGALADNGTLDDVVNDMSQSGLGSDISENLKEGDFEGAMDNIKDYAAGDYQDRDVRGGNAMDALAAEHGMRAKRDEDGNRMYDENGEALYEDLNGNTHTASEMAEAPNAYQELTEDQQIGADNYDAEIANAEEKAEAAEKANRTEEANGYRNEAARLKAEKAAFVGNARAENYEKAMEAGVADYAAYESSLADSEKSSDATHRKSSVEPAANMGEDAGKELDRDAQVAWDAAKNGTVSDLHAAGDKYNNHGLTDKQVEAVDEAVANGASEEEVAAMVDNFARDNFGDDYKAVVDKINEANGRGSGYTYGSNDNSDGNARTVTARAGTGADGSRQYGITDNNGTAGEQTIEVVDNGQGVDYTNATRGGGAANTVQTLDMADARNEGAQDYAGVYNSTAAMLVASGMSVGNKSGGHGSNQVVTVSEMAAMSSQMQMAEAQVDINAAGYGNNTDAQVGTSMVTAQVRATTSEAAKGNANYTPLIMTPIGLSDQAATDVGVTAYTLGAAPEGSGGSGGMVMLERSGGTMGGPSTIKVNVSDNADTSQQPNVDLTGLSSNKNDVGTMYVNLGANGDVAGGTPTMVGSINNEAKTSYGNFTGGNGSGGGNYDAGYYSNSPANNGGNGNGGGNNKPANGTFSVNVNFDGKNGSGDSGESGDKTIVEKIIDHVTDSIEEHIEAGNDGTGTDVEDRPAE